MPASVCGPYRRANAVSPSSVLFPTVSSGGGKPFAAASLFDQQPKMAIPRKISKLMQEQAPTLK
jgi:hypothetical protein